MRAYQPRPLAPLDNLYGFDAPPAQGDLMTLLRGAAELLKDERAKAERAKDWTRMHKLSRDVPPLLDAAWWQVKFGDDFWRGQPSGQTTADDKINAALMILLRELDD